MSEKKVECIRFKSLGNNSNVLGFADLFVPKMGLEIFGCTLCRNSSTGHKFISFPARESTDKEGKKFWFPYIRFRQKEHYEGFQKLAVEAIEEWCQNNATEIQNPSVFAEFEDLPF